MADTNIVVMSTGHTNGTSGELVDRVKSALDKAVTGTTKLPPEVMTIRGMSGSKYRAFVNNLIESLVNPKYLEIGSWMGSTLCSAICGNSVEAVAIDNWSLFGGPASQFLGNVAKFKGSAQVSFLERDFRKVDYHALSEIFGTFDVYLFDGPHEYQDQYDGLVCAQPAVNVHYVQIVDDWNWPEVRNGTFKAINDLGLHIGFMAEIRTTLDDQHAQEPHGEASDWHNGYLISVLSRQAR